MVLIRLIKADKRLAERIQQKLNFSNYQMLCLSWAIGLVMGIAIAILFFKSSVEKDNTFKWVPTHLLGNSNFSHNCCLHIFNSLIMEFLKVKSVDSVLIWEE